MKLLIGLFLLGLLSAAHGRCSRGCDVALASYYVWEGTNLTLIAQYLQSSIDEILSYNPQIPNRDNVMAGTRVNVPFRCECLGNGEYLGHVFNYSTRTGDSYILIAGTNYANLTTAQVLELSNTYPSWSIPDTGAIVSVPVNCSCGDRDVSPDYGLFITYPMRDGETLATVAANNSLNATLLSRYNPPANNISDNRVIFVPGRDQNGTYPPLNSSSNRGLAFSYGFYCFDNSIMVANGYYSLEIFMLLLTIYSSLYSGISTGAIAGISVAGVVGVLLLSGCLYVGLKRKKNAQRIQLLSSSNEDHSQQADSAATRHGASPGLLGITVDKSVEFSYDELAKATDDFSIANKIGQGGFGSVYYAELRGEKAAIKKMDMQASKEFLAELKVLTRVHHLNLVRLIGYCIEGSLFLVYEYIENGNLSQHLRSSGREPLSWSTRVQIALDSARGLEYIHEHTVPVYIHRDIKPANILIDKNYHAKVADFGLTKLTEVGSNSQPTGTGRLMGTFGYMPPEYAQYGDISAKVDVYAFGVVLYELISAKEAIVKDANSATDSRGLVALFEEVLSKSDSSEDLRKLIDPRLGNNYPLDSVEKLAQLAKFCTLEKPELRPTMRSIVVALMTLSSTTEDWDVGNFYSNQSLLNLASGR